VTALLVGIAGMAGVISRYGISNQFHGSALPWATVGINVAGSLLLGMLVSSHSLGSDTRTILGVGFLGGFTTFSTFTVQVVLDVEAGEPGRALLYLTASLVLGLLAATGGYLIGRELL
jgi:fluoride exporter